MHARGGGLVPAKQRQLYIDNARFELNPTRTGQGATFRADVVSFFFDEPQIRWSFTLTGPHPDGGDHTYVSAGTEDFQDFGSDFVLQIPWNGQTADGQPAPPGFYQGTLEVEVRERTRVGPTGGPISLPASWSGELEVASDKTIKIVNLAAVPPTLAPGQSSPIQVTAGADLTGFDETPNIEWELSVLDPDGLEVAGQLAAGPLASFEGVWNAENVRGGVYQLILRAVVPDEPGVEDEAALPFMVGAGRSLRIVEFLATPAQIVIGQETRLSFKTVAGGFSTVSPSMVWEISLASDGVERDRLMGVGLAGGEVETSWDGIGSQGVLPEGDYTASLRVLACEGETAPLDSGHDEGDCAEDSRVAQVRTGLLRLEVREAGTNKLLATSFDLSQNNEIRLNTVHELEPQRDLLVIMHPLPTSAPQSFKGSVLTLEGTSLELDFEKSGQQAEARLSPTRLLGNPGMAGTSYYAYHDTGTPGDVEAFLEEIRARNSETARVLHRGQARQEADPLAITRSESAFLSRDQDRVKPSAETLLSGGFEAARFSVPGSAIGLPKLGTVSGYARARSRARIVYAGLHGTYYNVAGDTKLDVLEQRTFRSLIQPGALSGVACLILAGCVQCNLFDIHNNLTKGNDPSSPRPATDQVAPNSPAQVWDAATDGQAVLLGYGNSGPTESDKAIVHEFFARLGSAPEAAAEHGRSPRLWMEANAKLDVFDFAAALDRFGYYYVFFREVEIGRDWRGRRIILHKDRQIRRIPRSEFGKTEKSKMLFEEIGDPLPNRSFRIQ